MTTLPALLLTKKSPKPSGRPLKVDPISSCDSVLEYRYSREVIRDRQGRQKWVLAEDSEAGSESTAAGETLFFLRSAVHSVVLERPDTESPAHVKKNLV
jgi:hypothetical protein